MVYEDWHTGSPGASGNCAYKYYVLGGAWQDTDCTYTSYCTCKANPNDIRSTTPKVTTASHHTSESETSVVTTTDRVHTSELAQETTKSPPSPVYTTKFEPYTTPTIDDLHTSEFERETTISPPSTGTPPGACSNLIGQWSSTTEGSRSEILILRLNNSGDYVHIEGLYKNATDEYYYSMTGWTGHTTPSIVGLSTIFSNGQYYTSLDGKAW